MVFIWFSWINEYCWWNYSLQYFRLPFRIFRILNINNNQQVKFGPIVVISSGEKLNSLKESSSFIDFLFNLTFQAYIDEFCGTHAVDVGFYWENMDKSVFWAKKMFFEIYFNKFNKSRYIGNIPAFMPKPPNSLRILKGSLNV